VVGGVLRNVDALVESVAGGYGSGGVGDGV
jgi:hypothetical protein